MPTADELVQAVVEHDVEAVMRLLAAGADPNAPDRDGCRPLEVAAYTPEVVVAALLERGADPEIADADGSTPLYLTAVGGETGKVRRLLAAGADPNRISTGPSDGSPLCAAACWGYVETVEVLLAHGADPNLPEDERMAPLDWAVLGLHVEVARQLLAAGADPADALLAAVERGSLAMVRALLEHGADTDVTDEDGRTPLALARELVGRDVERELRAQLESFGGEVEIRREPGRIEAVVGDAGVVGGTDQAAIVEALEAAG